MKYDIGTRGEFEVPEGLIEILQKAGVKGCKRDCEKCDSFDNCLHEFIYYDRFDIYPDDIYPEDIAEFTVDYLNEQEDFFEPPRFSERMEVGEWVVIAFGQLPGIEDSRDWGPYMLAYKISAHARS